MKKTLHRHVQSSPHHKSVQLSFRTKFYRGPSITFITLKVLKVNIAIVVIILCQVWGKVSLSCDVFVESKYKFS